MEFATKELDVVTPGYAEDRFGLSSDEYAGTGVYRIFMGSRGIIEDIKYLGDIDTITIPTIEECIEEVAFTMFGRTVKSSTWLVDDVGEYVEEFYDTNIHDGALYFGFTEEEYDIFINVS